jgi:cytochrome P450
MIGGMLEAMETFDPRTMSQRFAELNETFTELSAQRRAEPLDDLISALVSDESDLSDDEVISMITVLMLAGHETTAGLLGNSLVALAHHTDGPIEVGDITIPAGSSIALVIGAANRDTRRWPDADELRLDREDPRSISFGYGIHHRLGASLARLEMRVGIPAVLAAFGTTP